jgi:hypothetical protein
MSPPDRPGRDAKPTDALLEKARAAVERERRRDSATPGGAAGGTGQARGGVRSAVARLSALFARAVRPFRGIFSRVLAPLVRRAGRAVAWAAFARENGTFRLDRNGRRVFSRTRLLKSLVALLVVAVVLHAAVCAAYFYGTRFEELVYTTGKQEIDPGERYQFTGCTSLPCNTLADNGKYYTIDSSLYFPTLLYPEQNVFANIPQQNAACHVRGYGFYFRSLRWLYKSAQWYQKVYDVSCRPYDEQERAASAAAVTG